MYKFENLIEEVKELNTELKYGLDDIVGVTIEKGLIPTVANLTQTALDKFYIVKPETFIYNPRTHGVRLGMGYNETSDTYITSWNNVAFRVKETAQNIVLPQYLWLYFCRPIWDRITNFLAWGSSTIVFAWKDFLNIDIDLPSIEKQREIVEEYETLSRRIRLNEQMIEKLEATAQALYRKMFVDGIDKENLPEGWRMGTLEDLGEIVGGATPSTEVAEYWSDYDITWLSPADLSKQGVKFIAKGAKDITSLGFKSCSTKMLPEHSILFSSRAPIGLMAINTCEVCTNQGFKSLVPNSEIGYLYAYYYLLSLRDKIAEENAGSTFDEVSGKTMKEYEAIIPPKKQTDEFTALATPIFKQQELKEQENSMLSELQSLLLAKMGNLKQ